jgi:hypothetical protein
VAELIFIIVTTYRREDALAAVLRSLSRCIFLNGDCLVRRDFVGMHRRLAEPGWFVSGNRVLLSREQASRVLNEGLAPENWDWRQCSALAPT